MVKADAKNSSSAEEVYQALREHILDCSYKPGSVLNERRLAEEFGMSRTPIREAIYKLEVEGLVKRYPNVGIIVTELTVRDVMESFQVRELLEPYAARLAPSVLDKNKLEYLLKVFEELISTSDQEELPYKKHCDFDTELHDIIVRATDNSKMISIMKQMCASVERLRWIGVKVRYKESTIEHRDIIKAMLSGDLDCVEQRMLEHLRNAKQRLIHSV